MKLKKILNYSKIVYRCLSTLEHLKFFKIHLYLATATNNCGIRDYLIGNTFDWRKQPYRESTSVKLGQARWNWH